MYVRQSTDCRRSIKAYCKWNGAFQLIHLEETLPYMYSHGVCAMWSAQKENVDSCADMCTTAPATTTSSNSHLCKHIHRIHATLQCEHMQTHLPALLNIRSHSLRGWSEPTSLWLTDVVVLSSFNSCYHLHTYMYFRCQSHQRSMQIKAAGSNNHLLRAKFPASYFSF